MINVELNIPDEPAMLALGEALAVSCEAPLNLHFVGNLGAGKTTLIRGFLRGLGYEGKVKSPTYTLVEPYTVDQMEIYHFDLYRVKDPEELEFIGIQEYFNSKAVCLVEWPELGEDKLPPPDITCYIEGINETNLSGRKVKIVSLSDKGISIIKKLKDKGL